MKAILNAEAVNQYIDLHKDLNINFELTLSTYTARIKSNYCDIHFMKSEQPNRVFAAYNKVKNDVVKKPIKKINAAKLKYFSCGMKNEDFYSDVIYNIDIKSAYASILFNDRMISEETYNYLKKLPKMERLACVGMLAGKKNVFQMSSTGEVISETTIISPTSDYFFYCVKRTAQIIDKAAKHLGAAFLFSWVDGIYFLQNEKASKTAGRILQEYFEEQNLKTTFETLENFEVTSLETHFNCKYIKDGKHKYINVPKNDNKILEKITNHLINKNYEN
jgi:hypothetical protein